MKKVLSVFLAAMMLFAALPMGAVASAAHTVTIYGEVSDAAVERGNTFTLDVCIQDNPGLVGWNVVVFFDETALELVSRGAGDVFPASGMSYGPMKSPASITYADYVNPDVHGDGKMCTLTFKVKENAPFGNYTLTIGTNNGDMDNFCNQNWDSFYGFFNNAAVQVINHVHEYANVCDTTCNTCGAERVAPHSYANACDDTCNLCGATRAVGDHVYSNGYDTTCNECGAERILPTLYGAVNSAVVRGETFTMDICIKDNPGLVGWNVQVPFDETALELLSITGGNTFPASGMSYGPMKSPASATYMDFVSPNVTGDGTLFTLTFKVKEDAPLGDYTLTIGTRNNDPDNFANDTDDTVYVVFEDVDITILSHVHEYDHACDTTCNTCGAVRTVEPHPYAATVITAPTCGTEGVMRYTCPVCGDSYTDAIPATEEHTYVSAVTKAATCAATGIMTYTCSVCNKSYTDTIPVDPDNHIYRTDYDPNCEYCNAWRVIENVPADAPALVVDSVSARYDNTFTVAVRTRNNPGMVGFQLAVEYDTDLLTLVEWKEGDFANISCGPTANMPFRFNWADFVNPDNTTNGVLVYLTFKAAPGVDPTETAIAVRYLSEEIVNLNWENVCFATVDGIISLSNVTPGDVNEDGKVNIRDVGVMQQWMNGWSVAMNEMAADVNCDGKVNIRDIGLMQQWMNGWNVELGKPAN